MNIYISIRLIHPDNDLNKMASFQFPRPLEEFTFEEISSRGLVAIGPPVTVEGSSLNMSISSSIYEVDNKDIPKEAVAYVTTKHGRSGGNYAVIAMQFYKKP